MIIELTVYNMKEKINNGNTYDYLLEKRVFAVINTEKQFTDFWYDAVEDFELQDVIMDTIFKLGENVELNHLDKKYNFTIHNSLDQVSYEFIDVTNESSISQNLRCNFNRLTTAVLGSEYYNMGMDVMSCDGLTSNDIINKYQTK